jgi:3-dehydroquinate synthetase
MQTSIKTPYSTREIQLTVGDSWDVLDSIDGSVRGKHLFVLLDSRVDYFYPDIKQHFQKYPRCHIEIFHSSETAKIVSNVFPVFEHISTSLPLPTDSAIVTIGGGITLNVGGFIASVLGRGVDLLAIPTTPMAIADVAFGSKHALNTLSRKNYIGSYFDPLQIIVNTSSISTINLRHIKRNSIESLKQFIAADRNRYESIKNYYTADHIEPADFFKDVLLPSAMQKMEILFKDPKELNEGMILQLGHFAAHSIEVASGYSIPHDKAVALGIYVELKELCERGLFDQSDFENFKFTVANAGIEFGGVSLDEKRFDKALQTSRLVSSEGNIRLLHISRIGQTGSPFLLQWNVSDALMKIKQWLR